MKIAIASDHAGYHLKSRVAEHLRAEGHDVADLGPAAPERCDYPDYAHAVARAVAGGEARRGFLVCGSGIGMSMAANRHPGVRAAVVQDATAARLSREHNDAQILCLGERMVGEVVALEAVDAFLAAEFQGGRHVDRVEKIELQEAGGR